MLTAKQKVILAREKKNKPLNHISLEMETSTHFPLLMKCVEISQGPIAELGSGLFSTPLLHWMCFERKWFGDDQATIPARHLITYESFKHYMDFAKKFRTESHEVKFVTDWEKEELLPHYGVVFIDHSPKKPRTRGDDALRFKDIADYVVLHDAGPNSNPKYGYEKIYPQFKYRYDWTGCVPNTTVLSNLKNLQEFHV